MVDRWILSAVLLILLILGVDAAFVVPQGFEVQLIGTNLNPTALRPAPDGRFFLCEKHGVLRVIVNDSLLDTPVLTLTAISTWNERGLIGIEFDPDFLSNNLIYLHYTWTNGVDVRARVSRFALEGNVADETSETIIFEGDVLTNNEGMHNGGSLIIDDSEKMFIFIGDAFDRALSQDLTSSYGKVHRIYLNGTIPDDNPYYGNELGIHPSIWAYGLRNPLMASYRPETDQIYIAEVGQSTWEELNVNQKNANYGWPSSEGFVNVAGFTAPKFAYNHNLGCAITSMTFYRNVLNESEAEYLFPAAYRNKAIFGDYCRNWVRVIDIDGDLSFKTLTNTNANRYTTTLITGTVGPVGMTQGHDGGLYFAQRGTSNGAYLVNMGVLSGSVYKLIYTGSSEPKIYQPLEQWPAMPLNRDYTLLIGATGVPPLTYKWYVNDVLSTVATEGYSTGRLTSTALNGTRYRVQVSNVYGSVMSNEVVLLLMDRTGLTGSIGMSQTTYSAGDTISFNATIVDNTNDPIRLVSWAVDLSHQTHSHPFATFSNVDGGRFTIPLGGELDPVQSYVITLIVHNSVMTFSTQRTVKPRITDVILDTNPPGLTLLVNDMETPAIYRYNITGVVNTERDLYAPGTQSMSNETFVFMNWSDGNTSNGRKIKLLSRMQLLANYCNVLACPDIPLAPITLNADFVPPVAPVAQPIAPPIGAPVAIPTSAPISVPMSSPITTPITAPPMNAPVDTPGTETNSPTLIEPYSTPESVAPISAPITKSTPVRQPVTGPESTKTPGPRPNALSSAGAGGQLDLQATITCSLFIVFSLALL